MKYTIGDRVFIVADNAPIGGGVVIAIREGSYPYLVRTDDGKENWYATYEVFDDV